MYKDYILMTICMYIYTHRSQTASLFNLLQINLSWAFCEAFTLLSTFSRLFFETFVKTSIHDIPHTP